jgi:hypothetical protein
VRDAGDEEVLQLRIAGDCPSTLSEEFAGYGLDLYAELGFYRIISTSISPRCNQP